MAYEEDGMIGAEFGTRVYGHSVEECVGTAEARGVAGGRGDVVQGSSGRGTEGYRGRVDMMHARQRSAPVTMGGGGESGEVDSVPTAVAV